VTRRWRSVLVVIVTVGALAGADRVALADSPAGVGVQFGRFNYAVDQTNSYQTQASRWPVQTLQRDHLDEARELRSAGASTLTFYADPMVIRPGDPEGYTTALSASDVEQNHPEWLLRDAAGDTISRGFGDQDADVMMDPGNVDYQAASASRLIDLIQSEGWDGVLLDEINQTWSWTMSTQPAKYSTQDEWEQAVVSYVQAVCGAIIGIGKSCLTNTGAGLDNTQFWNTIAGVSTGSMAEFYVALNPHVGGAPARATVENGWWWPQQDRLAAAENTGTPSIFHAYASNGSAVTYALGSYLLAWQGHGAFSASTTYGGAGDYWSPEFDAARRLGAPVSDYQEAGELLWRQFAGGYVVVNPHDTAQTASVNGSTVTLDAASADIVAG